MTLIFSSLLSLSIHLNQESNTFLKQAYVKSQQPTVLLAFMDDKYKGEFASKIKNSTDVSKSYVQDYYTGTFLSHGKSKEVIFFTSENNKDFDSYRLPQLSSNEIMLSQSIKNTYRLRKNQKITLKPGNKKETFKIKGFFNDPIFSSALSGQTRILVGVDKFNQFGNNYPKNEMAKYKLLSGYTDGGTNNVKGIDRAVNTIGVLPSNSINYSFTSIQENLNLIPSIFVILLISLSFFIFVSILIVIWYSITVTVNV